MQTGMAGLGLAGASSRKQQRMLPGREFIAAGKIRSFRAQAPGAGAGSGAVLTTSVCAAMSPSRWRLFDTHTTIAPTR
jgi:hypothetical protein